MRADRLVSILLMLQRQELVTAAEVAEELEVSERTARRDLDALAMAGVPVYSQRGRGGGWRLAGGGRLDLSGLRSDEVRALFVLAGPRAGVTPEARSALRKLVRALPEPLRDGAEAAASSVVVDAAGWDHDPHTPWRPPMLDRVEAAVVDGEQVRLGYANRSGERSERLVHPLGLATKGRRWYVVADTSEGLRTFRVDRIESVLATGDPVLRPAGFELSEAWAGIVADIDQLRTPVVARGRVRTDVVPHVRMVLGRRAQIGEHVEDSWEALTIRGASSEAIARDLAAFGATVVIEDPDDVRTSFARLGAELGGLYGP